jgi:hypothetical protein
MRTVAMLLVCCYPALAQIAGFGTIAHEGSATYTLNASGHKAAVLFRVPRNMTLSGVLWRVSSVTAGDTVRVSIQGVSSFRPDGNIVASGNTSVTASGWQKTLFSSQATLAAGTDYAMVWDFPSYSGGNMAVFVNLTGACLLSHYLPLRARFGGSSWTATYDQAGWTAFLLYDQSGALAPHVGVPVVAHVSSYIGTGGRFGLEFTATRAVTIAGVQWVSNSDQAFAGEMRLYRNGTLVAQVSIPTYGTTFGMPGRRYAYFATPATVAPGNRVKIILHCTGGNWRIYRAMQSDHHPDMWPLWNWVKRLFSYVESPVCGTADSSDNITSTAQCYLFFPIAGRSTILSGGFVTQQ